MILPMIERGQPIRSNHHAALLLAAYVDSEGDHLLFERKSAGYFPPYFSDALKMLGGNRGKDHAPRNTLEREVAEEFGLASEDPETLATSLGDAVADSPERSMVGAVSNELETDSKRMGELLMDGWEYRRDYVVHSGPPLLNRVLTSTASVFWKGLTKEEYRIAAGILMKHEGVVTTDTRKYGGRIEFVPRASLCGERYAWGNGHIVSDILGTPVPDVKLEDLGLAIKRLDIPQEPTYADYARFGITFGKQ